MMKLRTDLKRSTSDRWLMGVCGGIAHRYGWRPNAVRLMTVIVSIAIPGPSLIFCLMAYIALGLLLPESEEASAPLRDSDGARREFGEDS